MQNPGSDRSSRASRDHKPSNIPVREPCIDSPKMRRTRRGGREGSDERIDERVSSQAAKHLGGAGAGKGANRVAHSQVRQPKACCVAHRQRNRPLDHENPRTGLGTC